MTPATAIPRKKDPWQFTQSANQGREEAFGSLVQPAHDEVRGDSGANRDPAHLKQTHQQARDQISARRSEGGGTHNIERAPCLHSEHSRHVVVQCEAKQPCRQETPNAGRGIGAAQRGLSDLEIEADPEKDGRISRKGAPIPWRSLRHRHGNGTAHVFRN